MSHILPYLYLGSIKDAKDRRYNYIVNVSDQSYTKPYTPVITLLSDDIPTYKISKYFSAFNDLMNGFEARRETCLVHCIQGISRSATIVAAYLMYKYNMTPSEAISYIRQKREIVNPNPGFMRQLTNYHAKLRRASSP